MNRMIAALLSFFAIFGMASVGDAARQAVDEPAIQRLDDIRAALLDEDATAESNGEARVAQWYNWPNWANWANWNNWPNWANWANY